VRKRIEKTKILKRKPPLFINKVLLSFVEKSAILFTTKTGKNQLGK
jgi:hypothetical protein